MKEKLKNEQPHLIAGSDHWLVKMMENEITWKIASKKPLLVYRLPDEIAPRTFSRAIEEVMKKVMLAMLDPFLYQDTKDPVNMNFTILYDYSIGTKSYTY